jgi:hypothetical protein
MFRALRGLYPRMIKPVIILLVGEVTKCRISKNGYTDI